MTESDEEDVMTLSAFPGTEIPEMPAPEPK
jgi:hypothetical protein